MKQLYKKLMNVQNKLDVPKNRNNKFGGFKYRSAEDILEAVKPLLLKEGLVLIIGDEVVNIQDRFYIKAIANLSDTETGQTIQSTASAREPDNKKGMDVAQVTGSTSSYARKYALNGLFSIDDTKDPDATNQGKNDEVVNPTATQLEALYSLGEELGIEKEDTIRTLNTKFGTMPTKITMEQYNTTVKTLENMKEGN